MVQKELRLQIEKRIKSEAWGFFPIECCNPSKECSRLIANDERKKQPPVTRAFKDDTKYFDASTSSKPDKIRHDAMTSSLASL